MDLPLQLARDIFHAKTSFTQEDNVICIILFCVGSSQFSDVLWSKDVKRTKTSSYVAGQQ